MEEINWPRHRMLRDRSKLPPKLACLHENDQEVDEYDWQTKAGFSAVKESLKYIEQYIEGNSEEQRVSALLSPAELNE